MFFDRTRTAFARTLRGEHIPVLDSTLWFMAAVCFLIALAIVSVTG